MVIVKEEMYVITDSKMSYINMLMLSFKCLWKYNELWSNKYLGRGEVVACFDILPFSPREDHEGFGQGC
jgi:hypothetical protein